MQIDHIGIAVKSLAEAVKVYENTIGLKVSGYDQVDDQGVRIAMLTIGESRIELLEPIGSNSPIEKFMTKRGEGIHHIAVQVDDIDAALQRLKAKGVRVAMLNIGESRIELLEPIGSDSPIEKFMTKRGEGIHHIAVRVDNIEQALERLKSQGVRLVDSVPRRGAHNTRTAFIHPSSTHGVLLELVEHGE